MLRHSYAHHTVSMALELLWAFCKTFWGTKIVLAYEQIIMVTLQITDITDITDIADKQVIVLTLIYYLSWK